MRVAHRSASGPGSGAADGSIGQRSDHRADCVPSSATTTTIQTDGARFQMRPAAMGCLWSSCERPRRRIEASVLEDDATRRMPMGAMLATVWRPGQDRELGQKRRRSSTTTMTSSEGLELEPEDEEEAEEERREATRMSMEGPEVATGGREPERTPEVRGEDVILFTSVQQLCFEVIGKRIINKFEPRPQALCLFLFGRQNSSRGELAVELVEHSPLSKLLDSAQTTGRSAKEPDGDLPCPLFHHLDVASLIVANIDERIREYQSLVAQTMRVRELDETYGRPAPNEEAEEAVEEAVVEEEEEEEERTGSGQRSASEGSAGSELVTWSTKQRSMLQLKLIKYSNCVTAKWVAALIQRAIDKLESQLEGLKPSEATTRVYLINLVPNQLSLFQSCLFLQQPLLLRELQPPSWALKFERRTNIRLLGKERVAAAAAGSGSSSLRSTTSGLKFDIKLPQLMMRSPEPSSKQAAETTLGSQADLGALATTASNLLAENLHEKLGPKFNDNFAQQFGSAGRLTEVRYNPTRNYNYASHLDEQRAAGLLALERPSCAKACSPLALPSPRPTPPRSPLFDYSQPPQGLDASSPKSPLGSTLPVLDSSSTRLISPTPSQISGSTTDSASEPTTPRPAHVEQHGLKWAIELELFDSSTTGNRWRQTPAGAQSQAPDGQQAAQKQCLFVFQPPLRAGSRSPLVFVSGAERTGGQYQLLAVPIAYPNGQSQSVLEARRLHPRTVRPRSGADLSKLAKLIAKAQRHLAADLEGWLAVAIAGHLRDQQLAADLGAPSCAPSQHQHQKQPGRRAQPSLVVYALRLDCSRLRAAQAVNTCCSPAESCLSSPEARPSSSLELPLPSLPRLTLTVTDPAGREPLVASTCNNLSPSRPREVPKSQRHVQFKLSMAPERLNGGQQVAGHLQAQQRSWIGDNLFLSCTEVGLLGLMKPLAHSLSSLGWNSRTNQTGRAPPTESPSAGAANRDLEDISPES